MHSHRSGRLVVGLITLAAMLPAGAFGESVNQDNDHYCDGCQPPLIYNGGRVVATGGPDGLTVTPIYWATPEPGFAFPSDYVSLINGYIANVAAASNTDTNVYSIDTEYYDVVGGQPSHLSYHITAGTPIMDTRPLPAHRCKPLTSEYGSCITEDQLVTELKAVIAERHLPVGLNHFYPVFIPPGVETKGSGHDSSASTYCAWHTARPVAGGDVVFGNEPYPMSLCQGPVSPNHNRAADTAIDNLSHELNEASTDPLISGWWDASGREIGDICAYNYGPPIGSSDPNDPLATGYNQVINGGLYHTQTEFSNYAFRRFGDGMGCQPSESAARGPAQPKGNDVAHIDFDGLYPESLPADGKSVASLAVGVSDAELDATPNDEVYFSTYVRSGQGRCGTVTPQTATTDKDGIVFVRYRASQGNVACAVVANETLGGKAASGVIYQGTARPLAPKATARYPKLLVAGGTSTFTMKIANPTGEALADVQVLFGISPPRNDTPVVRAGQIKLSVSRHGARGPFVPVDLGGSFAGGGSIVGLIGGDRGFKLAKGRTATLTYRLRTSRNVPQGARPILQFQSVLSQVNPATGASAQLGYTGATNTRIRPGTG